MLWTPPAAAARHISAAWYAVGTPPETGVHLNMELSLRFPEDVVHSDPERLGGTPVFVGTRVPVQTLFDYLEAGDNLEEFLHQFPSVRREQAIAALEYARAQVMAGARTA